jgi:succinate-acetate transporter protein
MPAHRAPGLCKEIDAANTKGLLRFLSNSPVRLRLHKEGRHMASTDSDIVPIANPAPLGLCGFALTTFVLSALNAGLLTGTPAIVVGLAFFYGGLAQLLAGMWEFKTGNTFGATAFSSYGAFWISFAAMVKFNLIPAGNGIAFFLLGWTIFTGLLLLATLRISVVLIALFTSLFVTFLLLTLHAFGMGDALGTAGGYLGILTAFIAWYAALAGLLAATKSPIKLPVGAFG